ncbi:MAG TPA: DUF2306 domain-containing protein [Pedobacter sp.]|uniref:DUF2306 domain-containing protein n=1 Tax=Pedobacter sp. TaxID=1411316 RepID=UPI002BC7278D|nr:DUF2306 domain-containing protein [Pedobacter sp.]HMI02686.1 DUF2306 domain-containing protein [Pedobacter sp.]
METVKNVLLWFGVIGLAWYFMHGADHFLELTRAAMGKYFDYRYVLILHITAGGGALILGPPQFWAVFRKNRPKIHRIIGYLYCLAVLTSGTTAVVLAFTTAYKVNWAYAFSLQVWVSVWLISTFAALIAAVKRKFKSHSEWMVRSYLSTLAFVISGLAIKLPFVVALGSFADISPSLFWAAWAIPFYIYQLILFYRARS